MQNEQEAEEIIEQTWVIDRRVKVTTLKWSRSCRYCGVTLLTGEEAGFCCGGKGEHLQGVPRLPPQSEEIRWLSS